MQQWTQTLQLDSASLGGALRKTPRPTTIPSDDPRIPPDLQGQHQLLTWPSNFAPGAGGHEHRKQNKGMKRIRMERGISQYHERRKECEACQESGTRRAARAVAGGPGMEEFVGRAEESWKEEKRTERCWTRILDLQYDFSTEKPEPQLEIEKLGHKCVFLPPYHCELKPIELYWAYLKNTFRKEADGKFPTANVLQMSAMGRLPSSIQLP
ncbi:hypothetical protein JCM11641_000388 [Rhodosporidiobolus odoratus]